MSKIVLTGGGTAGHITPNLALLPELQKHFKEIHYIGGAGIEAEIVPKFIPLFHTVSTVKLNRENPIRNLKIPIALYRSVKEAKRLLEKISPNAVFSKGGYVSLPVCFAAKQLNIPVITHESDFSLGVANKMIAKVASILLISFLETDISGVKCRTVCTGCPVREEIYCGNGGRAILRYKIKTDKPVLLVVGGSVGSKAVNEAVVSAFESLSKNYSVVHITGKSPTTLPDSEHYKQLHYADDIADLFDLADTVVTRAGATSLAELTALHKKILAVPLPKGTSRGDQIQNAKSYEAKGLIRVLRQEDMTSDTLVEAIGATHKQVNSERTTNNSTNAKIVQEIVKAANNK